MDMVRVGVCFLVLVGTATAALPIRKFDLHAEVDKVEPATEAEKKAGLVATLFLKGRKEGVPLGKDAPIHRQMGKLVPLAGIADLKPGLKVSVWLDKKGAAEGVLVFP